MTTATLELVKPQATAPEPAIEPWVDLRVVAKHIGFGYQTTRRRVMSGELPGRPYKNGKKTYWRCRLSDVDEAIKSGITQ